MRHTSPPDAYKSQRSTSTICHLSVVVATVTMLLLAYYWTAFVASVAVLPPVAAHVKNATLPSLLDATFDELTAGLECGRFSSVDLVNVSNAPASTPSGYCGLYESSHKTNTARHTSSAFFKSILHCTWSPSSIPMLGKLLKSLTKRELLGNAEGMGSWRIRSGLQANASQTSSRSPHPHQEQHRHGRLDE